MQFSGSSIFSVLEQVKMEAYPCAAHRMPKNGIFQRPAGYW